jgi:hypothetical protein
MDVWWLRYPERVSKINHFLLYGIGDESEKEPS